MPTKETVSQTESKMKKALDALHDEPHRAVRRAQQPMNHRDGANFIYVVGSRVFEFVVLDREETHQAFGRGGGVVNEFERAFLSDAQR